VPLASVVMPRLRSARRLHALQGRREVRNDRADAGLKVPAFKCFAVDAIVDASDLALHRGEAAIELLDRFGEVVLGHHGLDDVGQHLAEFFECCFLGHTF
jgi:hypothetical protein